MKSFIGLATISLSSIVGFSTDASAVCISFQYVARYRNEQRDNKDFRPGDLTNKRARSIDEKAKSDVYCFDASKAWLQSEPQYPYPIGSNISQTFVLPSGQDDNIVSSYTVKGDTYLLQYRARITQPNQPSYVDRIIGYSFSYNGSSCKIKKLEDNYIIALRTSANMGSFAGFRLISYTNARCSAI